MPDATAPAALVAVDLPARIDHGLHDRLRAVGLPVYDMRPLYLIKPQRDLTYVTTETGELRCGPSDLIVYDPRTDKVAVMDAIVAAGRYAPIAAAAPAERAASTAMEDETNAPVEPAPSLVDPHAITPTGEGVE